MSGPRLILILGPTAVGKTDYAIDLALKLGSPVISCDSRQIYKEMTIGTAVPSPAQLALVKHYFIHSHSIFGPLYSAGKYELEALALLDELFKSHDSLVMVGGSGLYADAVCRGLDDFPEADLKLRRELNDRAQKEGIEVMQMELQRLDPESYASIDVNNWKRVVRALEVTIGTGRKFSSYKSSPQGKRNFTIERKVLEMPRDELYARIDRRVDLMMDAGLLEEARALLPYRDKTALQTVGYKELFEHFDGKCSLEEAVDAIKLHTRHYAKRQISYFKRPV
ncbi:MAG: tRNA (adenosine(37)-N6)-dimethylallyltransferase MiaA [Bacteroidales bacterium]|nr:tRNA (adenosine(37)-N6)-dimethylallyltransferase MiaA [Bacteroidales bacterium]